MSIPSHTTQALKHFFGQDITRVSLSQLYTLGRYLLKKKDLPNYKTFEIPTNFLYKELPIRLSQCIKGFYMGISPYSLHKIPSFHNILQGYTNDFEKLVSLPPPDNAKNDEVFMETLREMNKWHQTNLSLINQGLRELSTAIKIGDPAIVPNYLLEDGKPNLEAASSPAILKDGEIKWVSNYKTIKKYDIDPKNNATFWNKDPTQQYAESRTIKFFEWFYSMCLGTQLLIEDQIYVRDHGKNYVRKITPFKVLEQAVGDARKVARNYYGIEPPNVKIIAPNPNVTTVYIPHFLHSILFELLKNSLRATMDFYKDKPNSKLPDLKLIMVEGVEDLTFKVSDEGGGIPYSQVENIWSYINKNAVSYPPHTYTNPFDSSFNLNEAVKPKNSESSEPYSHSPLFGYGIGLPTARLIARYFGGDLDVVSMEGYGSDFYLHLHRSGNVAESTPDINSMSIASASSSVSDLIDSLYDTKKSNKKTNVY
ncbi:hypothetical protein BB559_000040 [Furculomyces boomerangus]|uniref:Protein-serine/threonine kinase n=2 Tax=Harpellales TaxID=61421 RepID=A0A2T9Z6H5_9FUNG|nr:hypothetical protein BB559_000040 [Furculomyces boomerangus]PWA01366.1 hypothetical protein BB558_002538 [Smittium angustum]